eukprot:TRINITY_DN19015_c0_g1_i2.p1 TRINITY_DN19015_c0_g1~~TRINITY_DN19015_c0_g1_i2.p1  ORF type:complete len:168 (+),score=43.13 TRINITY_DN19015_c0_g1_i2:65-505(+)
MQALKEHAAQHALKYAAGCVGVAVGFAVHRCWKKKGAAQPQILVLPVQNLAPGFAQFQVANMVQQFAGHQQVAGVLAGLQHGAAQPGGNNHGANQQNAVNQQNAINQQNAVNQQNGAQQGANLHPQPPVAPRPPPRAPPPQRPRRA